MKLVQFTRDMRPYHKGDTLAVPDEVANAAVAAGDATHRDSIFDSQPATPARQRYLTRKRT